jgi:beta-galactosidase
VYCYTDYPSGELFVNGKSQGRITKNRDSRLDRYRLRWNNVKYEPGELKVVVYDEAGNAAGEQIIRTAGKPAALKLDAWTQHSVPEPAEDRSLSLPRSAMPLGSSKKGSPLVADGNDMAFITVSLTDAEGTLIPNASDQLTFEVSGAGTFEAVCNGDATSLESFKQPTMKLFNGQLVVIVRAAKSPGTLTLKVTSPQRQLSETINIDMK